VHQVGEVVVRWELEQSVATLLQVTNIGELHGVIDTDIFDEVSHFSCCDFIDHSEQSIFHLWVSLFN